MPHKITTGAPNWHSFLKPFMRTLALLKRLRIGGGAARSPDLPIQLRRDVGLRTELQYKQWWELK